MERGRPQDPVISLLHPKEIKSLHHCSPYPITIKTLCTDTVGYSLVIYLKKKKEEKKRMKEKSRDLERQLSNYEH